MLVQVATMGSLCRGPVTQQICFQIMCGAMLAAVGLASGALPEEALIIPGTLPIDTDGNPVGLSKPWLPQSAGRHLNFIWTFWLPFSQLICAQSGACTWRWHPEGEGHLLLVWGELQKAPPIGFPLRGGQPILQHRLGHMAL